MHPPRTMAAIRLRCQAQPSVVCAVRKDAAMSDTGQAQEDAPLVERIDELIQLAPTATPKRFAMQGLPLLMEASARLSAVEGERDKWDAVRRICDEQAEDEALWAIYPFEQPIVEAYLQQELRRLTRAVEAALAFARDAKGRILQGGVNAGPYDSAGDTKKETQ